MQLLATIKIYLISKGRVLHCSNFFSRLFGKLANYEFPRYFQVFINRFYVRLFKIDLSEFAPLESYKSLNALFTRSLAKPRDLATTPFNLISPTDSLIIESGIVEQNRALQIKGMSYDVPTLLGEANAEFSGMKYINLYLSPKDYHHYHAPCDLEILETRYFSGKLAPVNIPSLNKNDSLYNYNEREIGRASCRERV